MGLSARRKAQCIKVIRKLMERRIAMLFCEPVDPTRDKCENYFDVIKKPMDLGTVLHKLRTDQYEEFTDFVDDVELVWRNAKIYNPAGSPITLMSMQLRDWFHDLIFFMTDDDAVDWVTKLTDIQYQVAYYSRGYEEIPPKGRPPPEMRRGGGKQMPSRKHPVTHTRDESQDSDNEDDDRQRKDMKKRKTQKRAPGKKMSYSEVEELTQQINALEDEAVILKVIRIIRQEEPTMSIAEDSKVNMLQLSTATRFKIQDYLQSIE